MSDRVGLPRRLRSLWHSSDRGLCGEVRELVANCDRFTTGVWVASCDLKTAYSAWVEPECRILWETAEITAVLFVDALGRHPINGRQIAIKNDPLVTDETIQT